MHEITPFIRQIEELEQRSGVGIPQGLEEGDSFDLTSVGVQHNYKVMQEGWFHTAKPRYRLRLYFVDQCLNAARFINVKNVMHALGVLPNDVGISVELDQTITPGRIALRRKNG